MDVSVRRPAVAGTFYPASPDELSQLVDRLIAGVPAKAGARPKALIAPHAGYIYSGPIAASAYACVKSGAGEITRVVIVGPAHRVYVQGLVSPGAGALRTPLGTLPVDRAALAPLPQVAENPRAHEAEHSLEVQLPFLQRLLPGVQIVPLAVGEAEPEEVAAVLEALWGGPETLVVISSDLSHYLGYREASAADRRTADRVLALDPVPLEGEDACGCAGINGLVEVARRRGLRPELLDLRSSGDTAGPRDQVVGYGAFAFYEGAA
jgi:hypothetical protein